MIVVVTSGDMVMTVLVISDSSGHCTYDSSSTDNISTLIGSG